MGKWLAGFGLMAALLAAAPAFGVEPPPAGIPHGAGAQAGPNGYNLARPSVPVTAFRPGAWHVFLIAADRAEPVFDNAVARLARHFEERYGIKAERFSARARPLPGARTATLLDIRMAAEQRRIAPNDACLFYFTSHGEIGGIAMASEGQVVAPAAIDALIDKICGARPTILVVSACHSGTFLRAPVVRRNRIVLTAARADRSSFGCSFRETLTVYDRCFLESWDKSATFQALHGAIEACVTAAETARRYRPASLPQAFFGRTMRDFSLALLAAAGRR